MSKVKNYPSFLFVQKSFGAEPEPPLEVEYSNGVLYLTQESESVSISPESFQELFDKIKGVLSARY